MFQPANKNSSPRPRQYDLVELEQDEQIILVKKQLLTPAELCSLSG
jgi:hypothetical protein